MLKEFKDFAFKGNMIDMAVGIIIGGAFGLVVKSLVDNIIMPLIAGVFKMPDFSQMYFPMDGKSYESLAQAQKTTAVVAYGTFINNLINLLIVAFALFIAVKYVMGALHKKEEVVTPAPAAPPKQEVLLEEIRDLLKKS
jgi:large conductance mechanosensitive channel